MFSLYGISKWLWCVLLHLLLFGVQRYKYDHSILARSESVTIV
jgi:hypothetical protein